MPFLKAFVIRFRSRTRLTCGYSRYKAQPLYLRIWIHGENNESFYFEKRKPLLFKFKMVEINHDLYFSMKERYSYFRVFKIHLLHSEDLIGNYTRKFQLIFIINFIYGPWLWHGFYLRKKKAIKAIRLWIVFDFF